MAGMKRVSGGDSLLSQSYNCQGVNADLIGNLPLEECEV